MESVRPSVYSCCSISVWTNSTHHVHFLLLVNTFTSQTLQNKNVRWRREGEDVNTSISENRDKTNCSVDGIKIQAILVSIYCERTWRLYVHLRMVVVPFCLNKFCHISSSSTLAFRLCKIKICVDVEERRTDFCSEECVHNVATRSISIIYLYTHR